MQLLRLHIYRKTDRRTNICTYIKYIHTFVVYLLVRLYLHTHLPIYLFTHIHVRMHAGHVCEYMHTRVRVRVRIHAGHVCVCMHTHVRVRIHAGHDE